MGQAGQRVEIDISSPQRRELVSRLCRALNDGLSRQDRWEAGCELCHWQAAADSFELLPRTIIETILDNWAESEERLDEIEFSGYLDTEDGHRAWGFIALRTGQPRIEQRPVLENLVINEEQGMYALHVTISRSMLDGEQGSRD